MKVKRAEWVVSILQEYLLVFRTSLPFPVNAL